MDIKEKQEYAFTEKRLKYNNSWEKIGEWKENAQQMLLKRMDENGFKQIFVGLKLSSKDAVNNLFENPELNKLVSTVIDIYDELPLRPDIAFDLAWRSLEIAMELFDKTFRNKPEDKIAKLILRTSSEVIYPELENNNELKQCMEDLIKAMPLSIAKFVLVRMATYRELAVSSQRTFIVERTKESLGEEVYKALIETYDLNEVGKSAENHFLGARKIIEITQGNDFEIAGKHIKALDLPNRISFIISCILFTSRCERFHGDYFSHFKSDRASLRTYHHFYYLLTFTYILLWIVIGRHVKKHSLSLFDSTDIIRCIEGNITKMKIFPLQ